MSEVQDFIFGGSNARFWMLRKHVNSMTRKDLQMLPFYSWQCISLKLESRDIDLVIRKEADMDNLLKLLIFDM